MRCGESGENGNSLGRSVQANVEHVREASRLGSEAQTRAERLAPLRRNSGREPEAPREIWNQPAGKRITGVRAVWPGGT
jgi:hypothetical protein